MSTFAVPTEGLPLSHSRPDSKEPQQIIRIDLNERISRDLLRAVKSNDQARVRLGRKPGLTIGTKHVSLVHNTNKFPQEIFSGPLDGSEPAYFSGKLSLTLETLHAKEAIAGVDHALANLKNTLKSTQEERAASEAGVFGNRLLKPLHRPSPLSGGLLGSRPSSPFLASGLSPRPGSGPTSAPLMSGMSKQEKIKLDAIRIPIIHLLAIEPQDPQSLTELLRVKRADLDKVLDKVARSTDGKKELKDRSYRELDVWKFPYKSQHDRQVAIDHAVSAYDRLRVEKSDNLWQMLLAKEDRGKGIFLSKLNFDKPVTGNLTPKLAERSTDSGSTEGKSMVSDQSNKNGKVPISKATDSQPNPKLINESKPKPPVSKDPLKIIAAASKESKKSQLQSQSLPAKQDVRFKSSAKVRDFDEEADAAPSRPASRTTFSSKRPPKDSITVRNAANDKRATVSKPTPIPLSKQLPTSQPQKSQFSGANNTTESGRLTPSTMAKTRSGADTSKSQGAARPRNGSSPAKPSPLGSSPPANSRDVDTTSNSSKGTSQSSAPSSPPSSADLSQNKRKNYSPVVTEPRLDKQVNGTAKRKAEVNHEQPPAKRQQVKKDEADQKERPNGRSKPLAEEVGKKSRVKRESSDSDASSTSEKPLTKQQVVKEARRFQKYWDNYKKIHDNLSKEQSSDRREEELDNLWKMHIRLKAMKEQIWKDWARLEKVEAAKQ